MAIAFECPVKGILRDENGRFSEREILDMLTGKARDKRAGFDELKKRKIIKQLPDKSFYCKRIYEDARISEIRKTSGKKGGNPSLLLKQNSNQMDKQILTPSLSSSSSSSKITTKQSTAPPTFDKDMLDNASIVKLKKDIDSVVEQLYEKKIFTKVHAWKNKMLKEGKNERAILHVLLRCVMKGSFGKDTAWGYCTKIIQAENGNYNEKDYNKTTP